MVKNIVVVGGGVIGVSTSFYLSRHEQAKNGSISITLVEANCIASGASGKAGGSVLYLSELIRHLLFILGF